MTAATPVHDPGSGLTERMLQLPDGRAVRSVTAGSGGPLVVFEAGLGGAASSLAAVQRTVATEVATLAYDRAGLGGSDPDPGPRDLGRLTDDLVAVLAAVPAPDGLVLMGHSWGVPIVLSAAARDDVAVRGLVLVDGTCTAVMSRRIAQLTSGVYAAMAGLARMGIGLYGAQFRRLARSMDAMGEPDIELIVRDAMAAQGVRAAAREARGMASSLAAVADLDAAGLPDVPTRVILGGVVDRGWRRMRPVLIDAWQAQVTAQPSAQLVVAEAAGHYIPQQAPDMVAAAILDVVGTVRGSAREQPAE